jgi:hypothetical protein
MTTPAITKDTNKMHAVFERQAATAMRLRSTTALDELPKFASCAMPLLLMPTIGTRQPMQTFASPRARSI